MLFDDDDDDDDRSTINTKVSEFVFSRIAVVHSWFPGFLALTS